ncbi:MAG: hypothetical protein M3139_02870 [Bacteroidota bacterium]|nr:hypothetical protein [Bacteroidota bacterium]
MKQSKLLSSAAIAVLMLFSCNSGNDEKTTDTTKTDTTVTAITEKTPATPAGPSMTLLIKHKVSNFAKWYPAYQNHDSVRLSYGLHDYVIARGIKDSNMVMVALRMDDTTKAKQFAMDPGLKTAMQKGGVEGTPKFYYTESKWHDSTTDQSTTRVIILQKVKDWDAWKKAFDGHKQARMDAGLTDRAVSTFVGDPHMVSVVLVVNDMKKAQGFMNSKDLKDKMMEAGVEGAPDIFFYNVIKQY